jgi:CRP/FNR family transcriptional regulator, cyclic AMP receptor protein
LLCRRGDIFLTVGVVDYSGRFAMPEPKGPLRSLPVRKLSVLREHPFFHGLESSAFDQLCRYAKAHKFKRGETVFSKGDAGDRLFAVVTGTVKMSISSVAGRSVILNLIGAGEIFGEIAMLDGLARTTDAIANTTCEILVVDRRDFIPFVQNHPALSMKFIELLCARLRQSSGQIEQIILQNLPGRLASALIRLETNRKDAAGQLIAITQQEIAEMVGTTRESINKQLRTWAANKWVRLEHGAIVILDSRPLAVLASTAGWIE